jgi:hypothetical protein
VYLAVSYPTIQFSLRCSLDKLIAGDNAPFSWMRHTCQTVCVVGGSLVVAVFFRKGSNALFALTGSTAVCVTCYILPVMFHFQFRKNRSASQSVNRSLVEVTHGNEDGSNGPGNQESILFPALAVTVGVIASGLSLYTSYC